MNYDHGALEASLAAAVGDEPALIAELRNAFHDSAAVHLSALRSAQDMTAWSDAARRLHGLAASFGVERLLAACAAGLKPGAARDASLRTIERALASVD